MTTVYRLFENKHVELEIKMFSKQTTTNDQFSDCGYQVILQVWSCSGTWYWVRERALALMKGCQYSVDSVENLQETNGNIKECWFVQSTVRPVISTNLHPSFLRTPDPFLVTGVPWVIYQSINQQPLTLIYRRDFLNTIYIKKHNKKSADEMCTKRIGVADHSIVFNLQILLICTVLCVTQNDDYISIIFNLIFGSVLTW